MKKLLNKIVSLTVAAAMFLSLGVAVRAEVGETVEVTITSSAFSVSATAEKHYSNNHYQLDDKKNDWAKYAPTLSGGVYEIEVYVPIGRNSNVGKNNIVEISCATGVSTVSYNAQEIDTGYYKLDGQYTFEPGNSGYVKITDGDDTEARTARAGAVKFTKVAEANLAYLDSNWIAASEGATLTVNFTMAQESTITDAITLTAADGSTVECTKTLAEDRLSVTVQPEAALTAKKAYTLTIADEAIIGTKEFAINVFEAETVTVDNADSKHCTANGGTIATSGTNIGKNNLTLEGSAYAIFTPELSGGVYEIYSHVPYNDVNLSEAVGADITSYEGTDKVVYNSRNVDIGWYKIGGTYTFVPGTSGSVKLYNTLPYRTARADAVKFVKVADANFVAVDSNWIAASEGAALTVNFAMPQDSTITDEITLTAADGSTIECTKNLAEDGLSVTVQPATALTAGKTYTLTIADEAIIGIKEFAINAFEEETVIVDDAGAGFSYNGGTYKNTGGSSYNGTHWMSSPKLTSDYALFTPALSGGVYEIYSYVPYNAASLSKVVKADITSVNGVNTEQYNSYSVKVGWYKIGGQYTFEPGTSGSVKLYNGENENRTVRADAVKFVKVADANFAGIKNTRVAADEDIVIDFVMSQADGIENNVTLVDNDGNTVEAVYTLSDDKKSIAINPDEDLSLAKSYTVTLNEASVLGTKSWTVTTTVADEVIVTPSDVEYFKYYGGSFDLAYGGYNGKGVWHSLNTNATNGEYAVVSPDLAGGKYRVYSYIHVNSTYSKAVGYEVTSLDTTKKGFYSMMNQPVGWVDLGTYEFAPGMDGTVKIYLDVANEYIPSARRVAFSALKFVKVDDNATAWVNDRVEANGNIEVKFSSYQDADILDKITVTDSESNVVECDMTFGENNMSVIINPENDLTVGNTYVVSISDGEFTNANSWNVLAVENNANVVLDEESKTADVNVSYVNGRKGNIVVALYKENKLVGVKSTESNYDTEKTIEDVSYSDTPDYIKVMLWSDMSNMKPVYKTIEKPIV